MELIQSEKLWSKFLEANGYQLVSCVGQGSFGDVYSVTCLETGKLWAVKRLVARRDIQEDSYAMSEIEALASIQHPTVVDLKEILLCPRLACIVMELAPVGNLEILVLQRRGGTGFALSELALSDITFRKLNNFGFQLDPEILTSDIESQNQCELVEEIQINVTGEMNFEEMGLDQDVDLKSFSTHKREDQLQGDVKSPTSHYSPPPPSPEGPTQALDPTFLSIAFTQITSALAFCHDLDLAHMDVNPSNILVFGPDLVKLADFGLCFRCREKAVDGEKGNAGPDVLCSDYLGRDHYTAPEVRRQEPFHAKPADVWSLGCVLYFMLKADHPPVATENILDGVKDGTSMMIPVAYESALVEKCLATIIRACQFQIKARPTMKDVLTLWDT